MESADNSPLRMNADVNANLVYKVTNYLAFLNGPQDDKRELKLKVYGDNDRVSRQMWKSLFSDDIDMSYTACFPLIPIPANYIKRYEQYEKDLRKLVAHYVAGKNLFWGVYNLAVHIQEPRMHLVFANRRLKRSEFGNLTLVDNAKISDPRFISILLLHGRVSVDLMDRQHYSHSSVQNVNSSTSTSAFDYGGAASGYRPPPDAS